MGGHDRIRRLFRLPPSSGTLARDVDEEIAFHLESRIADLVRSGVAPEEARHRALARFGNVGAARDELVGIDRVTLRRARRASVWDAVAHEVRLAARGLARAPGFTATVVVTLALGIGVNAAMFSITDRLLLSPPLHVRDAERLVRLYYQSTPPWQGELTTEATMPYADYVAQREGVRAFSGVAAYGLPQVSTIGRGQEAAELTLVGVSPGYFELLGVRPTLGRFFSAEEAAEPSGRRVVVLGHGLWRSRYGGDPGVIGREVVIDNASFSIIGVAPRGFHGIDLEPVEAWVPLSAMRARLGEDWHRTRAMAWIRIIARLAPGVGPDAAAAEATAAYLAPEDYQRRYAEDPTARIVLGSIIAARAPAVGIGTPQKSGRIALWLFGVSTLVLIIACANAANLLLARGLRRRRETGVRIALGGGRRRIAGQVLAEAALICVLAGGLALLLAHWSARLGLLLLVPELEWGRSPLDARVLLFAAAAAVASALFAAAIPALHASRSQVLGLLALGGRGGTFRRSRLRAGLVALQATLAVVLLVGAGLFFRSLQNATTLSLGFEPERVALIQWHRTGLDWSAPRVIDVYARSLERVRALPEVEAAALSMNAPLFGAAGATVSLPGRDSVPRPPGLFGYLYNAVSPDYFRTMGTTLLRGRAFTEADTETSAPVVVVTASMAELLWPGEDALGKCLVHQVRSGSSPCRTVVGIAEDVHYRRLDGAPDMMFYLPLSQGPPYPMRVLSVRAHGEPGRALPAVGAALHGLESGMPPLQVRLLEERIAPQIQPWRLGAALFSGFGVLALVLAALGLHGVVSYDVGQRTRELGVRSALGAVPKDILLLVLRDALSVVGAGLLVGLALALAAAPHLSDLLFQVRPRDEPTFAVAALLLLAAALVAALVPGWRATRVQPVEALREE